jgi:predicted ArsR family transcriptional regulator
MLPPMTADTTPKAAPGQTREQVRRLYAEGITVRQIAAVLGISTQAVYTHLRTLRRSGAVLEPQEAS